MDRRRRALMLAMAVAVSACATPAAGPSPSVVATPQLPNSSATAAPTVKGTRPAGEPAVLLVEDDGSGRALRARPIDPRTLADLPGYAPIPFGHHYVARVSPDGTKIAALLWPSGSNNSGGQLHLIGTRDWTDEALDVHVDAYAPAMRWDSIGHIVYWAQPTITESTPSLFAFDLGTRRRTEVAKLPHGYYVRDLAIMDDLAAVYLAPALIVPNGEPVTRPEPPTVALVDLARSRVADLVHLPVRDGQIRDDAADPDMPWTQIQPGLAWDPARRLLYVADAESDGIFRLDLRSGQLSGPFEPRPRHSMLDALWALLGAGVAEAKMTNSTIRQAALSADGGRLFVSGARHEFRKAADGKYHERVLSLGLTVVDTSDFAELATDETPASRLWPSPDGGLLYASERHEETSEGWARVVDPELRALGASGGRTLPLPGEALSAPIADRGRSAYVTALSGTAHVVHVDLDAWKVIATRDLERHFAEVFVLGR